MGWLPNRLPPRSRGLALDRGAGLSVLAVAWLEEAALRSGIRLPARSARFW